jgi:hypothetical protein
MPQGSYQPSFFRKYESDPTHPNNRHAKTFEVRSACLYGFLGLGMLTQEFNFGLVFFAKR